jgi:hypothetical protein
MTNLYGLNAVTRSNGYGTKSQSVDEIYNSFVLGKVGKQEIQEPESVAGRFIEDVFAPVVTATAEDTSRISWASRFPTFSKIISKGGKVFDGLTGFIELGKSIYNETFKPNGSGEEIVVSVGRAVAKSATTSAILGAGMALTSSVFPLLVPGTLVIAAAGAGLWYLPNMAARAAENTIRGLGYAAGFSGQQGREAYDWLQEKGVQIGNKISQAEDAAVRFKELLASRKAR